jgi:hypothetical protein
MLACSEKAIQMTSFHAKQSKQLASNNATSIMSAEHLMSSLNANELDGKRLFATTLVQWLPCATFSPGQANGSQAIHHDHDGSIYISHFAPKML